MNRRAAMSADVVTRIVKQMTLEEKAGLCSGLDIWHTKPVNGPVLKTKNSTACSGRVPLV
jgi:hypothetical protein